MDTSTPAGTWYLLANASRLELSIQFQNNTYSGTIRNEGGAAEPLRPDRLGSGWPLAGVPPPWSGLLPVVPHLHHLRSDGRALFSGGGPGKASAHRIFISRHGLEPGLASILDIVPRRGLTINQTYKAGLAHRP